MLSLGSAGYGMKNSFRLHRITKSRGLSGSMTGIRVLDLPDELIRFDRDDLVCNHYDGGDNSVFIGTGLNAAANVNVPINARS